MRTFSKVLAVVLCVAMLFTTAFASGLSASYVDFSKVNGNITARADLRNDTNGDLTGKIIVASYDANGNLIATGESAKTNLVSGAETIVSASVAETNGATYKAFLWNDSFNTHSKHAVKGAIESTDFVKDNGTSNGLKSKAAVNSTKFAKTDAVVYTGLNARTAEDSSTEYGARYTSNMGASTTQYHEVTYVDPSLEGLDYFAFVAGATKYSDLGNLLEFDIVKNAEVMILASHTTLEFEGYDLIKAEDVALDKEKFVRGRYMDGDFTAALRAVGVTPTYELANIYTEDKEGFYDAYLAAGYEAATDAKKATFTEEWNSFTGNGKHNKASFTYPEPYIAIYSKTYRLEDGEESAHVVIPEEGTGTSTRNILVVVKPLNDETSFDGSFEPITKAGSANAAPALKGVEIDGEYVSIDKFTSNAYNYKLNPAGDCVLPVIKGITADNAIYSTTDYDIAKDGKTAVATLTVKNLYTSAAPVVYTVNIAIDGAAIPADAFDIVNLKGTTIVDDTDVLKSKTIVPGIDGSDCPIDTPVCLVNGMTYADYIAYINEYYGLEEGDAGYVVGNEADLAKTETIKLTSFAFAKNFEIGQQMGTEGNRRLIKSISPQYAFLRNYNRFYGSIALNQLGSGNMWFSGALYFNKNSAYNKAPETSLTVQNDGLRPVPWYSAVMKETGTVYVASHSAIPVLVSEGYELISSTSVEIYSGIDTNNSSAYVGPKYLYRKVFQKGETVEIFNPANGSTSGHPPAWFFTTGTPDIETLTYGKKSSAAVATARNTSATDGVLYKGLFADVHESPNTTGGRWVYDFQPLGSGQRIIAINDPTLAGVDYFAFSINNRNQIVGTTGNSLLEFKVDKDCEVQILSVSQDSNLVFDGYEEKTGNYLSASFPTAAVQEVITRLGVPTTNISIDMIDDLYKSANLTFTQVYNKWMKDYFPGATEDELFAAVNAASTAVNAIKAPLYETKESISAYAGNAGTYNYNYAHTKDYKAGSTVVIPEATGQSSMTRPVIVVVKPKLSTAITDHVTDFQIVASTGAGSFILGPGAHAAGLITGYSDRLMHCYSTEPGVAPVASAYSINNQRIFRETDEILGLENCYYLRYINQNSLDKVLGNTAKADWIGGADKEDLPWMTFTVNQDCDIIIVPSAETPKFVTRAANGWYKNTLSDYAFTLSRKTNNDGGSYQNYDGNSQKVMYVKSFKAGDTVTLYNGNNGSYSLSYDKLPYFAFVRVK